MGLSKAILALIYSSLGTTEVIVSNDAYSNDASKKPVELLENFVPTLNE